MSDLTGRIAIVTGSGQGIGHAIALELARRGATVVTNDVSGARGHRRHKRCERLLRR